MLATLTYLAGIARVLSGLCDNPPHPLLFSSDDALTTSTSYTLMRSERIDYMVYSPSALKLESSGPLQRINAIIPDQDHPSDHLSVIARFSVRSLWKQYRNSAHMWLSTFIHEHSSIRPLTSEELRQGYNFFDRGDGHVDLMSFKRGRFN